LAWLQGARPSPFYFPTKALPSLLGLRFFFFQRGFPPPLSTLSFALSASAERYGMQTEMCDVRWASSIHNHRAAFCPPSDPRPYKFPQEIRSTFVRGVWCLPVLVSTSVSNGFVSTVLSLIAFSGEVEGLVSFYGLSLYVSEWQLGQKKNLFHGWIVFRCRRRGQG